MTKTKSANSAETAKSANINWIVGKSESQKVRKSESQKVRKMESQKKTESQEVRKTEKQKVRKNKRSEKQKVRCHFLNDVKQPQFLANQSAR